MKPIDALTSAVLARLRSQVVSANLPTLDDTNSRVEQDGRPPPMAPHVYISINSGGVTTRGQRESQNFLESKYKFDVFISIRTGTVALDRVEEIYNRERGSFDELESLIVAALHDKQALRTLANANLPANAAEFLFPVYYNGRGGTEVKTAEWSNEADSAEQIAEVVGWLVRKLPFSGADRIEYSSEII